MAKLIYFAITSLDGYIEDNTGNFEWAMPDEEAHSFANDLERTVGAYLYGRRMYETMMVWETNPSFAAASPIMQDFARLWQAADKIVYSRTLPAVATARTRIERDFDPAAVRRMKATASHDIAIGGPELASHAFKAGLVDECHLFIAPIIVGGGKLAIPHNIRLELELLAERRFGNGMVFLHYRTWNHGRMTELTSAQLLDVIQHGWATYVERYQSLSSAAQAEFLFQQGYARFTDLLAHIIAWWEEGKRVIEHMADDPEFAPPEYDVDIFNAQAVARFASWSEVAAIEAFEQMQATWLDLVGHLPDDAFHNQNIADRLRLELVAHLREHELPS